MARMKWSAFPQPAPQPAPQPLGWQTSYPAKRDWTVLNYGDSLPHALCEAISPPISFSMFDIYVPEALQFQDYIQICQVARTWADGYDRKDKSRLLASLASDLVVDYSNVVAAWGRKEYKSEVFVAEWLSEEHLGLKPLATQHLLGMHYFKSVSEKEIVVEWQQIASHGRHEKGEDPKNPLRKIEEQSNHRTYMEHTFFKTESGWRIAVIKPSVLFAPGDFMNVRRAEDK